MKPKGTGETGDDRPAARDTKPIPPTGAPAAGAAREKIIEATAARRPRTSIAAGATPIAPAQAKRKGKAGTSPTVLTLREMRKRGYGKVAVVEKWNPHMRIRQDLFGIGDVLAVGEPGVALVQTTSLSGIASRIQKIADSDAVPHLRAAGVTILVHGWWKNPRGRWQVKEVDCS